MNIGPVEFRPTLWPSVAVLVCLPILIGLGMWQLDRAAQKRDRQVVYDQAAGSAEFRLDGALADPARFEHRMVEVEGRFETSHTWLLDNRTYKGGAGYHVLSPFCLSSGGGCLIINRGWVPVGPDRRVLPAIETPEEAITLGGRIKLLPGKVILAGRVEPPVGAAVEVIQYVDLDQLASLIDRPLLPFLLRLAADQSHGYERAWTLPGIGQDKHLAYAVQWFGIAFALVAMYLGHATRRRAAAKPPESNPGDTNDD
jgi:surfeit locus 1 family protein